MNATLRDSNHRILVIDDNAAIHEDMRKVLCAAAIHPELQAAEAALFGETPAVEPDYFEIDSALQGEAGVQLAKKACEEQRPYALAFIDIRMPPGWDGLETISRLWQHDPDIQVALCTAYSDYSWHDIVRRVGKTDNLVILKKPFDTIEVVQLACALTKKWWLAREVRLHLDGLGELARQRTDELREANERLRCETKKREVLEAAIRRQSTTPYAR